jgi:hypothetical protein
VDELKIAQEPLNFFNIAESRLCPALFHASMARKKGIGQQSKPAEPEKKDEPLIAGDLSKITSCAPPPPRDDDRN